MLPVSCIYNSSYYQIHSSYSTTPKKGLFEKDQLISSDQEVLISECDLIFLQP